MERAAYAMILDYRGIVPRIGDDVFIAPGAFIIGDVVIGEHCNIWFNAVIRGDVNYVRIGSWTSIQDNSTLHVNEPHFPLLIGDRVLIAHQVVLHGCTIGDDCFIGMGAVILDGCKVGTGSFVAAGSLLPPGFVVPPESLVMGFPAKIKGRTGDDERTRIRSGWVRYAELAADYLKSEKKRASESGSVPE